ncbi:Uncharacterized protein dnm_047330 [Desulfonema magnum]|uniref:Uncharacterized protein n=1 Tax=Desulfonema magnum TaxID=45655 RepID=A0A975BNF3_9BACT|nr:Uncharacterized protein dnm_047330 [Desulfonema magnum]
MIRFEQKACHSCPNKKPLIPAFAGLGVSVRLNSVRRSRQCLGRTEWNDRKKPDHQVSLYFFSVRS